MPRFEVSTKKKGRIVINTEYYPSSCGTRVIRCISFEGEFKEHSDIDINNMMRELFKKIKREHTSIGMFTISAVSLDGARNRGSAFYNQASPLSNKINLSKFAKANRFKKANESYNTNSRNNLTFYTKAVKEPKPNVTD